MKSKDLILGIGAIILLASLKKAVGVTTTDMAEVVDPVFKALPVAMVQQYTINDAVRVGYTICGGGPAWKDPDGNWHAVGYTGVYDSQASAEDVLRWGNC